MKVSFLAPWVLVALVFAAMPTAAQTPLPTGETLVIHPEAKTAIDRIKSPYCPGMMLEVCTSAGGAMLRDSIQRMAERGLSADSMVEVIIADYGEEWRALPKRSGAGLVAWVIPPGILAAGLGLVGIVLAARKREQTAVGDFPDATPEDDERIRAALRQMDEEEEPVF